LALNLEVSNFQRECEPGEKSRNFSNYFWNSLNKCLYNIVMNIKKTKVSPLIIFVFYSLQGLPFYVLKLILKFNIYLNLILKLILYFNINIKFIFFTDLQSPFQTKSFAMSAKKRKYLDEYIRFGFVSLQKGDRGTPVRNMLQDSEQ